jgi:hypothetical protein
VKVFVSSTFKDMQAERDMLQLDVLPEIEEIFRDNYEELTFIDLRWGINTQSMENDEHVHKILSVCLDEIDEAKPYFIAFLGDRYGWIPDKKYIKNALDQKPPEFSYLADLEQSVTALEIEYGTLAQKGLIDHCLFYFRKPIERVSQEYKGMYCSEGEESERRLNMLKSKIINSGGNIKYYTADWDEEKNCVTGLDKLKEEIISDLKKLIEKDFGQKKKLQWQEREIKEHELFYKIKLNAFSARPKLCDEITKEILAGTSNLIMIKGKYGFGKSTMIAKLAANARERNAHVLLVACCQSKNTLKHLDVWRQIAFYLENLLSLPHKEDEQYEYKPSKIPYGEWRQYLAGLFSDCSRKLTDPIIILIDGGDQLAYSDDFKDFFRWLAARLPKKVAFAFSCTDDFEIPSGSDKIKASVYTLDGLNEDEKKSVLHQLELHYHKELTSEVKNSLISRKESHNPLYLSMMYHRMLMLDSEDFKEISLLGGSMRGQKEYMLRLIEDTPGDIDSVATMIMEEAASRINKEQCDEVLRLIAVTRRGLRDNDFKYIFRKRNEASDAECNMQDFYRLKKYMRRYLYERNDGRYDFTYESFRSGILKTLDETQLMQLNEEVFELMESLDDTDPVRKDEFVWFAWKCDKKRHLIELLNKYYSLPESWLLYKDCIARGLYDICMNDKGKWLIDVLKDLTEHEDFRT